MRPRFQLLDDILAERIIAEARTVLAEIGMEIQDEETRGLLAEHGAVVDRADGRVKIGEELVEGALESVPRSFSLHDVLGEETHRFAQGKVYFTPGSAAINILDSTTGEIRPPDTADYLALTKVVSGLERFEAQSTALVPADVPEAVSDS